MSLAKCIVGIVTNNKKLKELKEHLLVRQHPRHVIDYSYQLAIVIIQPKFQTENNDITFIRTSIQIIILI